MTVLDSIKDLGECPICKGDAHSLCDNCKSKRRAKLLSKGFVLDRVYRFTRPAGGGYAVLVDAVPVAWFDDKDAATAAKNLWKCNWTAVSGRSLAVAKG